MEKKINVNNCNLYIDYGFETNNIWDFGIIEKPQGTILNITIEGYIYWTDYQYGSIPICIINGQKIEGNSQFKINLGNQIRNSINVVTVNGNTYMETNGYIENAIYTINYQNEDIPIPQKNKLFIGNIPIKSIKNGNQLIKNIYYGKEKIM